MSTADITFSVIINTTDRAGPLQTLLHALEHQTYPHFEVVVVVGPTSDNTIEALDAYRGRVRVLRCSQANLGQSRNIGIREARGDVVAFIDDDAVPCLRWLEQLARLFGNPVVDATGGKVYSVRPDQPIIQHRIGCVSSLAEQMDVRASRLDHLVPRIQGHRWVERMMGTNMAYRRNVLLAEGGFDEFYEWVFDDSDLAMRLTAAGRIVNPVMEAVVYHAPASSRNRQVSTYSGKWWILTKAGVYFAIKNGRSAGDPFRTILRRALELAHGHWLWYTDLLAGGRISIPQAIKLQRHDLAAFIMGLGYGMLSERRLLRSSSMHQGSEKGQGILKFQNAESATVPSVDPIRGRSLLSPMPSPPLRICLLSNAYPPSAYEGVGRHTNLMAQGLFECGHTVHVIAQGDREQVTFYDGAFVHRIPKRFGRYEKERPYPSLYHALNYSHAVYERIKQLILNDGIQVVDSPLWQLDGLVTAMSGALPVVVRLQTAHRQITGIENNTDPDLRLMGQMEQALIRLASHLVPNSNATLAALSKEYNVEPDAASFDIIPHGIIPVPDHETRPFDPRKGTDSVTVLYVGRLEKRKGIQDLLEAIPLVLARYPAVKFVIAGKDNSDQDGFARLVGMNYPSYFAKRFPKHQYAVEFLGQVSEEYLAVLYQTCDLFVAPSLYESFGLIYLEAMNYAKPVIGCRAGGIPEVIDENVTGKLVDPASPPELANAILTFLQHPLQLREMGIAGRQRLLDRFTHIQMAQRFAETYRKVIHRWEIGASAKEQR